jgi:hypothetical protein
VSQELSSAGSDEDIHQVAARPFLERGATGSNLIKVELNSAGEPEWLEFINTIWELPDPSPLPVGTRSHLSDFPLFSRLLIDHAEESILVSDVASEERLDENFKELTLN